MNQRDTAEKIDTKHLAQRSSRMSAADISTIVNKTIILAIKEGRKGATNSDFAKILEQHYLGIRRSQSTPEELIKTRLAHYEAAKTVVSLMYPHAEPVLKTTILSKGDVGSQTVTNSIEDKLNYNKKELKALIVTSLAGREFEMQMFGGVSTSKGDVSGVHPKPQTPEWKHMCLTSECAEDYKRAMRLVQLYTKKMAMNERVSLVSVESEEMSDRYNGLMEEEASRLLGSLAEEARKTVAEHKPKIEMLVKALLDKETLDRTDIRKILGLAEEPTETPK